MTAARATLNEQSGAAEPTVPRVVTVPSVQTDVHVISDDDDE